MFNGHLSTQTSKLFFLKSETAPQSHLELLPVRAATLSFPRRVLAFINYSRVMQYREQHTLSHQGPGWFSGRSQSAAICILYRRAKWKYTNSLFLWSYLDREKQTACCLEITPHRLNRHRKLSGGHLDSILKIILTDFPLTWAISSQSSGCQNLNYPNCTSLN